MSTNRATVASLIVGLIGAVIGGFWGYLWGHGLDGLNAWPVTFLMGIISGFLSCFFVSQWYLKLVNNRNSLWGFGTLFAGLAGVLAGIVTGIGMGLYENIPRFNNPEDIPFLAFCGAIVGGLSGVSFGIISSLALRGHIAKFF